MRRSIEWKDTTPEGEKRTVRVGFFGRQLKWQFSVAQGDWDYETPPSQQDWEALLDEVQRRYARKRASHKDVLLVKQEMERAKNWH